MKDEKDLNSTKMHQRGKNPGQAKKKIPLKAWMPVSCECCVLSGRGLCVGLITHPEESLPSVVCLNMSVITKPHKRRPRPKYGPKRHRKKKLFMA
jgi:hypothetical protein